VRVFVYVVCVYAYVRVCACVSVCVRVCVRVLACVCVRAPCVSWGFVYETRHHTARVRCPVRHSNAQEVSLIQRVLITSVLRLIMNDGFSFES